MMIMLQQSYALTSKIKIANKCTEFDFSERHLCFYANYSYFILKVLRKSSFQEFLHCMLLSENINDKTINAIDIELFPPITKNGFNIVGKCNIFRGKIRIYPKTIRFCIAFGKRFGKDIRNKFMGERARAALIHELLHLKYAGDEKKVRELTESYFSTYMKKHLKENSIALHSLIFDPKRSASSSNRFNADLKQALC
jgi:hypothetical protein